MDTAITQTSVEETVPQGRGHLRALTGLLVLAALALGVWQLVYWEPRVLPVRVIEVRGELHHHSSKALQETIGERLHGGILSADLWDLKRAAEDLPWVGSASIRRVWPDRLEVSVQEHKPVGRWNDDGLVTAEGLVFRPRDGTFPAGLPLLEGPDERAREVVRRYFEWRDDLMLVGHLMQTVSVDARGAWEIELVTGPRLELGTGDVRPRLERFLSSAHQLEAAGQALSVDLRYSNGFAVRWAQPSGDSTRSAAARGKGRKRPSRKRG